MIEKRNLTCIGCPMGCLLEVTMDDKGTLDIKGYTCTKGKTYAMNECTNPSRIVTSSVKVNHGEINMVSVKTETEIAKDKILECMKELKGICVEAPVHIGDIIVLHIAGTEVNVIATKDVEVSRV